MMFRFFLIGTALASATLVLTAPASANTDDTFDVTCVHANVTVHAPAIVRVKTDRMTAIVNLGADGHANFLFRAPTRVQVGVARGGRTFYRKRLICAG